MKYLLLIKVRRDVQITPEIAAAHRRAILEQVEKGVAESVYIFAGRYAPDGMVILNADSPEQLNEIVLSTPGFRICDLEVYPLADFTKVQDQLIDLSKRSSVSR